MEGEIVRITHENVELVGEIINLRERLVMVEILEPFCNYSSFLYLIPEDPSSKHFFKNYKEYAKEVLIDIYKKLIWLDVRIERISVKYDLHLEEREAVKGVENRVVKERIEGKLRNLFFDEYFTLNAVGFKFTLGERGRIMAILEIYKLLNFKIYVT
jgi:hypothetical protein